MASDKSSTDSFRYKGDNYPTEPSVMDRAKEGFKTDDDRAQLDAIRQARQRAFKLGLG